MAVIGTGPSRISCNQGMNVSHPLPVHQGTAYNHIQGPDHAPTIVFVHGVGLDQTLWKPWMKRLDADFSLITFDLFGHGRSEDRTDLCLIEDFVMQIDGLTNLLSLDRFVLVGFSLGALISLAYASIRTTLSHLVLLHPVYRRNQEQLRLVQARLKTAQEQGADVYIEKALKRWFTEPYRHAQGDAMDGLRVIFQRNRDGYLRAYRLFAEADRELQVHKLAQVESPVLIITGSDDQGSTPEMTKRLANDLPNASCIINPGHRHMAPLEFAETLCSQISLFLGERR